MPGRTLAHCYLRRISLHLHARARTHRHTHTRQQMYIYQRAQTYLEKKALAVHITRKRKQIRHTPKRPPSFPKREGRHISIAHSRKALQERNANVSEGCVSQPWARHCKHPSAGSRGLALGRGRGAICDGASQLAGVRRAWASGAGLATLGRVSAASPPASRYLEARPTSAAARACVITALPPRRAGSGSGEWARGGRRTSPGSRRRNFSL